MAVYLAIYTVIEYHIMMQCFMIWFYRVSLWLSDAAHNIISFSFVLVAISNNVCICGIF